MNTAEVGYSQHLDPSGHEFLVWFTEMDIQGHPGSANDNQTWPCSAGTPNWDTRLGYRVEKITTTSDSWDMHINCGDSGGWYRVGPIYDGFNLIAGIPMGETGRREHTTNATGMMDDQNNLGYLYNGTWSNSWNYPKCYSDPYGDNNWEGVKTSADSYVTQKGSGSC